MSGYDTSIHCNCLDCRKIICHEQKACVTSCSHIFCLECANVKFAEALVCPACDSSLTQSNDISILAGLSPTVIMDICNRALSFYNYQVSQELCYRKAVQQSLESQLGSRQDRLEAVIRDHKRIVQGEMKKLQALTKENEFEKRRNHDLQAEIQTKSNQFSKLQAMYDKLKRRATGSLIQQSVQGHMSSVRPISNDKHQSSYQATQSPKSYAQPLYRNRQYQPPTTEPIRNIVDPTRLANQPYHMHPNQQQMNTTTGPSPLYSPRRVSMRPPPRNQIGTDHGPVLDPQQQHGWKQYPPPPPIHPPRNYLDAESHIMQASNHQFTLQ
ncbi:unnamed protein product [Absidia cylindrospora]